MKTIRKLSRHALIATLAIGPAFAQIEVAQARIAPASGSPSDFVIEGTHLPVTSTSLELKALFELQQSTKSALVMKVRNVGGSNAQLLIESAKPVPPTLEMSPLVLGGEAKLVVFTPAGNTAWIYLTHRDDTRFLPFAGQGTWFLGPNAVLLAVAKSGPGCDAATKASVPNLPALVGTTFVAQAVHGGPAGLEFTNPAAQSVRAR